ncbi:hypothetical protein ACKC9G_17095 [Pokkaliibacter sp. CJK22405]|uniref:hypothetical protein n=1 Tax=Pokkaliibacter sp. CJK22405 TaxID=3384615 RepID=UPI003984AC93
MVRLTLSALDLARSAQAQQAEQPAQAHTQDQAALQGLEALEHRLQTLRQQAPAAGSLEQALHQHFKQHTNHQQALLDDWFAQSPYAQRRRFELSQAGGGEDISAQYGISIATEQEEEDKGAYRKLRVDDPSASYYQRAAMESHSGFREQSMRRYMALGGKADDHVSFISSSRHLRELKSLMKPRLEGRIKAMEMGPGMIALTFSSARDQEAGEHFINIKGSRSSPYRAFTGPQGSVTPRRTDPAISNRATLATLTEPAENSLIQRLQNIPHHYQHASVLNTAGAMLDKLQQVLSHIPERLEHDLLLDSGLKALVAISQALPALQQDSRTLNNAFQILCEETQVCLAATKPYTLNHFREAAAPTLAPQALPPGVPEPRMRLTSSGMASLTQGLDMLQYLEDTPLCHAMTDKGEHTPIYFELGKLPHSPEGRLMFATLNPSQPGEAETHKPHWNVDDVINSIDTRLASLRRSEPLFVLLDATVEKPNDMHKLLSHCSEAIASGQLKFVVAKSYQKYATLGSAKVMAGGIGVISSDDDYGRKMNAELDTLEGKQRWHRNPESQLLTHMLYCRDSEAGLLRKAADNATFVAEQFFHGENGHARLIAKDNDAPFGVFLTELEGKRHRFDLNLQPEGDRKATMPRATTTMAQLNKQQVAMRSSFGFNDTVFSPLTRREPYLTMRLAFGQESRAELTEAFFMPSLLMHPQGSRWDMQKSFELFRQQVTLALKAHPLQPAERPEAAQILSHIARSERPSDAEFLVRHPQQLEQRPSLDESRTQSYTLNKLASILLHNNAMIRRMIDPEEAPLDGPDRQLLDAMLEPMIHSGMPGVSTTARQDILGMQSLLRMADMLHDPDNRAQHFHRWLDDLDRLPMTAIVQEDFTDLPGEAFSEASPADQNRLIRHLSRALSLPRQLDLVAGLVRERSHLALAGALLTHAEHQLDADHSGIEPDAQSRVAQARNTMKIGLLHQLLQQTLDDESRSG